MSFTGQMAGVCVDGIVLLLNHSDLTRLLQFIHLPEEVHLRSWRGQIQPLSMAANWLSKQQCSPTSMKMAESCRKNTEATEEHREMAETMGCYP